MEQSKKIANRNSIIFALIYGATYLPAVWLLKHRVFGQPISIIIAIVPIIAFSIFIFKLIKAFSVMDEVNQRVQLEAVVIGFSLTAMLVMILFLLSLCDISNPDWFGYANLLGYCWLFYFVGWFISKKKIWRMKNTIKVERAKKNWTQEDLARQIGISRQSINSIETGKFIPSTVLALKMAKVFGVNVESIFQLENQD